MVSNPVICCSRQVLLRVLTSTSLRCSRYPVVDLLTYVTLLLRYDQPLYFDGREFVTVHTDSIFFSPLFRIGASVFAYLDLGLEAVSLLYDALFELPPRRSETIGPLNGKGDGD